MLLIYYNSYFLTLLFNKKIKFQLKIDEDLKKIGNFIGNQFQQNY